MKRKASLKRICSDCKMIKRHSKIRVICVNRRHNQVQG